MPTIRGFVDARPAIEHLVPQVAAVGGELIVVDGSEAAQPSPEQLAEVGGDSLHWLSMPGGSVFQLRFAAYRPARGEVVAVTEDHCYVEPGLDRQNHRRARRYPEAAAVGGAVLNGTDKKPSTGPRSSSPRARSCRRWSTAWRRASQARPTSRTSAACWSGSAATTSRASSTSSSSRGARGRAAGRRRQRSACCTTSHRGSGARRWPSSTTAARSPAIAGARWGAATGCASPARRSCRCTASVRACASRPHKERPPGVLLLRPRRLTSGSSTAPWLASCWGTWPGPGDSPRRLF